MSAAAGLRKAAYATPTRSDMAVLMVMFNPMSSVRIVQNWLYVWNKMAAAGIPVFGAELVFPWQKPALADCFKTLTVRSDSIMFHKEKLLQRLEQDLPATYTKVCPIDCDIVFARPDWYDAVSTALDEHAIVQPYSMCHWMGPDLRTPVMSNPSAVVKLPEIRAVFSKGITDRLNGHPGFAMAMRRGLGLQFVWTVVGGGDAVLFRTVSKLPGEFFYNKMRKLMEAPVTEYMDHITGLDLKGDPAFVDGDIWHLWHGPLKGRQYYDRYQKFVEALPEGVQDIRDILVENEDGVWSWREDAKKVLNTMMLRYFSGRDDDAVA
jgi:hypothetical protein